MPEQDPAREVEQQEALARLLADLPDVGPMPPEVAARLDETIVRLSAAREASDVPDLATVRRRRRWTMGVAAAAAASIVAVGLGSLSPQTALSGPAANEKAADAAPSSAGADSVDSYGYSTATEDLNGNSPATRGATSAPGVTAGEAAPLASAPRPVALAFTSAAFPEEVTAWLAQGRTEAYAWSGACPVSGVPASARLFAATYDGAPAALVVLPPRGDYQTISIADCSGDGRTLDSTEVPAR